MLPLVTCIMPTAMRRSFVKRAVELFRAQDYPNKELVIVESECASDFFREFQRINHRAEQYKPLEIEGDIRYWCVGGGLPGAVQFSVGNKRNIACALAKGELIAHFDDDDWQSPRRLSSQVEALGDADLCGLDRLVFYNGTEAWLYKSLRKPWLAGSTLMYRRSLWERCGGFDHVNNGEDVAFIDKAHGIGARIVPLTDESIHVLMLHGGNTVERQRDVYQWSAFDVATVRGWMA